MVAAMQQRLAQQILQYLQRPNYRDLCILARLMNHAVTTA
jgi:hypothetical protein